VLCITAKTGGRRQLWVDAVEKVSEEMLWNRNAQRPNPAGGSLESIIAYRKLILNQSFLGNSPKSFFNSLGQ
jgi:hypothetical protein